MRPIPPPIEASRCLAVACPVALQLKNKRAHIHTCTHTHTRAHGGVSTTRAKDRRHASPQGRSATREAKLTLVARALPWIHHPREAGPQVFDVVDLRHRPSDTLFDRVLKLKPQPLALKHSELVPDF